MTGYKTIREEPMKKDGKQRRKSLKKKVMVICVFLITLSTVVSTCLECFRFYSLLKDNDSYLRKSMGHLIDDFTGKYQDQIEYQMYNYAYILNRDLYETLSESVKILSLLSGEMSGQDLNTKDGYPDEDVLKEFSSDWADDEKKSGMLPRYTALSMPDGKSVVMNLNPETEQKEIMRCDLKNETWFRKSGDKSGYVREVTAVKRTKFFDDTSIVVSKSVCDPESSTVKFFTSLIYAADDLKALFQEADSSSDYLIVDENGELVTSTMESGSLSDAHRMEGDIREKYPPLEDLFSADSENILSSATIELDGVERKCFGPLVTDPGWMVILLSPEEFLSMVMDIVRGEYKKDEDKARQAIRSSFLTSIVWEIVVGIFFNVLLLIFIWLFMGKRLRPIQIITEKVRNLSPDDMNFEMGEVLKTGDEIEELAESFHDMSARITEQVDEITRMSVREGQIEAEMNVATTIQSNMLPKSFPVIPGYAESPVYAEMSTAREVGGDFYDAFMIDDDHLAMVVGDVSGKGVPASLFMAISKALIKTRAMMGGSPSAILTDVNNQLFENNSSQDLFVTVWMGILALSDGKLVEANAGHSNPMIYRLDKGWDVLKKRHDIVLAGIQGIAFSEDELVLGRGDMLFVFTDGVTEARNTEQELYGVERLGETLNRTDEMTPRGVLAAVRDDVNAFMGEEPPFDDMTMLVVRY